MKEMMPEGFIVTITKTPGNFETDLEIPSQLTFAEMKGKLLEILKILDRREFHGWQDYALLHKNNVMSGIETLADIGAFDCSRFIVVKK